MLWSFTQSRVVIRFAGRFFSRDQTSNHTHVHSTPQMFRLGQDLACLGQPILWGSAALSIQFLHSAGQFVVSAWLSRSILQSMVEVSLSDTQEKEAPMEDSGGQQSAPAETLSGVDGAVETSGQDNSNEGHEETVREAFSVGSSEGDDGQATPPPVCDEWDEEPDEDYWTRVHGFTPQNMPYYDLTGQFDDFVHEGGHRI